MINYYQLGSNKRLNEIVMIGSHDAGIIKGAGQIQTQNLNIGEQAAAGVRIFDLRVTGSISKTGGGGKVAELRTYHSEMAKNKKVDAIDLRTGQAGRMDVKKMDGITGGYGQTLSSILTQARNFVTANTSEFLLLKFDKCGNWEMIAQACIDLLGTTLYTQTGNLNTRTLQELAGKVVVLFGPEAWKTMPATWLSRGILKFRNLYDKENGPGTYFPNFDGLQYVGKGGTQVGGLGLFRTFKFKKAENKAKQRKIMAQGRQTDPAVMGMMYWTTTGMLSNIQQRNDFMWNDKNGEQLAEFWESVIPENVSMSSMHSGPILKTFMPNFIMVDFADATKCEKIYALNFVSAMQMHNLALDLAA